MEDNNSINPGRLIVATVSVGCLVYVCLVIIQFFMELRYRMKFLSHVPALRNHWLLGHVYELPNQNDEGIAWMKDRLFSTSQGFGIGWYGPVCPVVETFHPNTVKTILKTSEPKPRNVGAYPNIYPWLGDGLLLAGGPKWARNRRLLTPAFHFDILRPYMVVNNRATYVFLSKLEKWAQSGEYFEAFNHVSLLTLDIILRCAFSYDIDCQRQGEAIPFVNSVQNLNEAVIHRLVRPWLYPWFIFHLTPTGFQFRKDCKFVHNVSEEIIHKRRETLRTQGLESVRKSRYLDFLDILLTAKDDNGNGLSDREIRNEVDTFLFEGHDTTASGISWTLYSLAKNPEHQERCQQEIDELLASKQNKDIEWDDLPKLSHLTMCIKEALRLHSPVPVIQRETTKDLEIEGRRVPAGTLIDVHIHMLHNNPQVWENPEDYRPERFNPDHPEQKDNYAFVPFSAGPRNCIGQHFAMHEMKVVVAKTLSRFTLTLHPTREVEHRLLIVMKTKDGMYMKATPRTSSSA